MSEALYQGRGRRYLETFGSEYTINEVMKDLFRGGGVLKAEKTVIATQIWLFVKSLCLKRSQLI